MRILFLYLSIATVFFATSCNNKAGSKTNEHAIDSTNKDIPTDNLPVITFTTEKHDFGTITEGKKASCVFAFKNEGKSDLLISAAQGSCGCTVPEYPKEPIVPGAEGVIKVTFDSHGKHGVNKKEVLITTNCKPSTKILQIEANVVPLK